MPSRPPNPIGPPRGLVALGLPAGLFLTAFFLVPLGWVVVISVTEPRTGLGNYVDLFRDGHFLGVLANTLRTALVVTLASLLLAYPMAYVAATAQGRLGAAILGIVALSFWTSYLVRTYAWMVILGVNGPVVALAALFGVSPAPKLLFTPFSATLGMTHGLVPFMTMALYAAMKRIDPRLTRAAASLGAPPWRAFLHVYLPLSAPGIVNGITLVFISCLGFYVMPVLLGSPGSQMIAGLVGTQIEETLDFGAGSAMAMVLLAVTLTLYALYDRFFGLDRLWR